MITDQLSEVDGFVLAMLCMMLLSAGVIALLIVCGLRNAARRDQMVDDLIDEVTENTKSPQTTLIQNHSPSPEPWEKDGDWLKK
jgi:hypothetical protein